MATAYIVWDRASRTSVGPVFDVSGDATAYAADLKRQSAKAADEHRKPLPTFDVVTVTV